MSTWATAVSELRMHLSDGPTDKLAFRKKCFGTLDGTNLNFKTFDYRRLTNFSTDTTDYLGVFVDDTKVTVSTDIVEGGFFTLASPPDEGATIEANYYHQWFNDTQLDSFLKCAGRAIFGSVNYTSLPEGLQHAALKYGSADAYQELSLRFARMFSEQFRVEDLPKEDLIKAASSFEKLAAQFREEALHLRDDYYRRQGQSEAPLFGTLAGNVPDVTPRR